MGAFSLGIQSHAICVTCVVASTVHSVSNPAVPQAAGQSASAQSTRVVDPPPALLTPPIDEDYIRTYVPVIRLRLASEELDEICTDLILSDAQRQFVDRAFESYRSSVDQFEQNLYELIMEDALLYYGDVYKRDLTEAEKRSFRRRLRRTINQQNAAESNRYLADLFTTVESVLGDSQKHSFPSALRRWRRTAMPNAWLHQSSPDNDMLWIQDVVRCFEDAADSIPELDRAMNEDAGVALPETPDLSTLVTSTLNNYEKRFDELVVPFFWNQFSGHSSKMNKKESGIAKGNPWLSRLLAGWEALQLLNLTTAEAIANDLRRDGSHIAADLWLDEFAQVNCPLFCRERSADVVYSALNKQLSLDETASHDLRAAYLEYIRARVPLRWQLMRMMIAETRTSHRHPGIVSFYRSAGHPISDHDLRLDEARVNLATASIRPMLDRIPEQFRPDAEMIAARVAKSAGSDSDFSLHDPLLNTDKGD